MTTSQWIGAIGFGSLPFGFILGGFIGVWIRKRTHGREAS